MTVLFIAYWRIHDMINLLIYLRTYLVGMLTEFSGGELGTAGLDHFTGVHLHLSYMAVTGVRYGQRLFISVPSILAYLPAQLG